MNNIKIFSTKIYDTVVNLFLGIRIWLLVKLSPKKFKNVINPIEKKCWELTFNDEFDKMLLDKDKWITEAYYGVRYHPGSIENEGNPPKEYYSDSNFEFEGSVMKQVAKKEETKINYTDWSGKNWGDFTIPITIGQIQSVKSFEQQYGYFEIRSKLPNSLAMWPAFWLCSKYSWPPEIDIYEIYTGKNKYAFESNIHWGVQDKNSHHPSKVAGHKVLDTTADFHLYACSWSEKSIKIYYDNILVRVFHNKEALSLFDKPMFVIIGQGIDDGPGRGLENANFPNYHEIDYVRVYKKK